MVQQIRITTKLTTNKQNELFENYSIKWDGMKKMVSMFQARYIYTG